MPRAPTGVSGSARPTAANFISSGVSRMRRRPIVMEALGQRHAVVLVVDPLLADGVSDPQHGAAEGLTLQAARVDHRSDVRDCSELENLAVTRLDVDFDFGEADSVGLRLRRHADSCLSPPQSGPVLPAPASERFVNALMSSGASWPSYLPPSSMAFFAACAKVMLRLPL